MQPKNIYPGAWTLAGHHATGANETFATGNTTDYELSLARFQGFCAVSRVRGGSSWGT